MGRPTPQRGTTPPAGWLPKRLRQAVVLLLVVGVCGFLVDGVKRVPQPYLVPVPPAVASPLSTFRSASLSITPGPGLTATPGVRCALVASTLSQQEQGLMGQTTLGRYAGMVFIFEVPTTDRMFMKNTLIPLSVAWFDGAGRYIAEAVMPPCTTASACPTYGPDRPFRLALEVAAGKLRPYGIGPGSTLHVGGVC